MTDNAFQMISRTARKNWPEVRAFLSGKMPGFLYGATRFSDIPVFCFHEAELPELREQLEFLSKNGYRTLDGAELLDRLNDPAYRNDGKDIVLTFDDALRSVWTVAMPLLREMGCKIILFAIPGLIPESNDIRPQVDPNGAVVQEPDAHAAEPLCNWAEIRAMHESGLVDVQSHGLNHALISTGPRVQDFVNPDFDTHYYGNIHIPLYDNGDGQLKRDAVSGHPVYEHSSRFSSKKRYLDSPTVRQVCSKFVLSRGGDAFFRSIGWKKELTSHMESARRDLGCTDSEFESDAQRLEAIRAELRLSRQILQDRLQKIHVTHFCFPWYEASDDAYRLASEEGYDAVHVGVCPNFSLRVADGARIVIRLEHEYLMSLPGNGQRSFISILRSKLQRRSLSRQRAGRPAS